MPTEAVSVAKVVAHPDEHDEIEALNEGDQKKGSGLLRQNGTRDNSWAGACRRVGLALAS